MGELFSNRNADQPSSKMPSHVNMSEHQICSNPNIWVFDDLLSDDLLSHVDSMFEGKDDQVQELHRRESCKPRNFRSAELIVDNKTQEIVDVIRALGHIREVQPCRWLRISDVWGDSQRPHMDGIDMDCISRLYSKASFLDHQKQSALQTQQNVSTPSPNTLVPTFSFVVYFNSVGGIRFPWSSLPQDSIPGKRGRIIMFQNYIDLKRPAHNPMATHYGIYINDAMLPKRLLTMGILANETPAVCHHKLGQSPEVEGLIYSPPLKDEGHYYSAYTPPPPPKPPTPPPKEEIIVIVERSPEPDILVFRNVGGDELCLLEFAKQDSVKKIQSQLYDACNLDSNKYKIELMLPNGTMLSSGQKMVSALPALPAGNPEPELPQPQTPFAADEREAQELALAIAVSAAESTTGPLLNQHPAHSEDVNAVTSATRTEGYEELEAQELALALAVSAAESTEDPQLNPQPDQAVTSATRNEIQGDNGNTDWTDFFRRIKNKPDAFYKKCVEALIKEDIFEPNDLINVDLDLLSAKLESGQMTIGMLTFIRLATDFAKAQHAAGLNI